eukprot:9466164-Pyramimonas_sp.AAC.1
MKDTAKVASTSSDGKAESGEAHAHKHPLPTPISAVATKEKANNALGKARSAHSPRPSGSDEEGSRTSYHPHKLKEDRNGGYV